MDDKTIDINTKEPSSQLAADIFGQFAITSADLFEKYGKDAYKNQPFGWGHTVLRTSR